MDWNNVDLNSPSERDAKMLDGYSFEILLLEIHCNLREINRQTVRAQFMEVLNSKVETAKEIFEANIDSIVKYALKERNTP